MMAKTKLTINEVNNLTKTEFNDLFDNIVENCAEAANYVCERKPFNSLFQFGDLFEKYLDELSAEDKKEILSKHPKLGTKGKLTQESVEEQKIAGLNTITDEQEKELADLNKTYLENFGFPYVICARLNQVETILENIKARLNNDKYIEIANGIEQVKKIARLRLIDLVHHKLS